MTIVIILNILNVPLLTNIQRKFPFMSGNCHDHAEISAKTTRRLKENCVSISK
jgi:hypothetical protein